MKIELIETPFPETVFRQSHERTTDRPHLSGIIRDLELTLEPDKFKGTTSWDLNSAAQIGVFWEYVLEMAYADSFSHDIGEVELDGIVGTPDGINVDEDGVYIQEFKLTWKSSRNFCPTEHFYYKVQGMSYCKMANLSRCHWKVLFVNGNYRGSGPQYKQWMVEFSELELQENWDSVLAHARYRGWI